MKHFIAMLVGALLFITHAVALAEVPVSMQFQGYLTDAEGAPLSGEYEITFTFYGSPDGQDALWNDTRTLPVEMGAFSAILGGPENPLDANIFTGQALWLGIALGDEEELSPRTPVTSVPYATRAAMADNAVSEQQVQAIINDGGYLTEYTETDPTVNALAKAILNCGMDEIAKWNGTDWVCAVDSSGVGAESDPIYSESVAAAIVADDIVNWNACYGWGDHAQAGYLTSYTETDPTVNALAAAVLDCAEGEIARYNGSNWECSESPTDDTLQTLQCENGQTVLWNATDEIWACGLPMFEEGDPLFSASAASGISSGNITNWNAAYNWGNHAQAGYLTGFDESDPHFSATPAAAIGTGDIDNWNAAFAWGDHAQAGYLTDYEESDPIYTADPASSIASADIDNWTSAYGWGDHSAAGYISDAYSNLSDEGRLNYDDPGDLVTLSFVEGLISAPEDTVYYAGYYWMKNSAPTKMTYEDGMAYCDDLELGGISDWRLPTIDELRALVVGCPDTQTGGACARTHACPSCWSDGCLGCDFGQGPSGGIYWPEGLEGDIDYYLSSSVLSTSPNGTSVANLIYSTAGVRSSNPGSSHVVRCVADVSLSETDPEFAASVASSIVSGDISNWNAAYGWGNHASAGYLTSYDESDPEFAASAASAIVSDDISNWNAAFGWGDHAQAGYVSNAYAYLYDESYLDYADDTDLVTKGQADANYALASALNDALAQIANLKAVVNYSEDVVLIGDSLWEKYGGGTGYDWAAAQAYCDSLDTAGFTDWRLPTIDEMRSIVDGWSDSETGGACNIQESDCLAASCDNGSCGGAASGGGPDSGCYRNAFIDGSCTAYWSSTEVADMTDAYWVLSYEFAAILETSDITPLAVRCIRD